MKVLVAGSTGYLGQHVVRELHARGHQVRALVRSPAKLDPVRDAVDETHQADATDPDALAGCCDGADAVFSSIGLMGRASTFTCWQVDYAANRNLLEEARRARVKKFIYTSVVRAPGLDKLQLVRAKRALGLLRPFGVRLPSHQGTKRFAAGAHRASNTTRMRA